MLRTTGDGRGIGCLWSLHTTTRQAGRRSLPRLKRGPHWLPLIPLRVFDVAALRHAVRGSVLAPGDEGWDEARTPWNVAFEQHPALIVVPANSADVQAVVRFATANGLRVAPQGTGHGVAIARRPVRRRPGAHARAARRRRSTSRRSRPASAPARSGRTSSTPRPSTAWSPCTARRRTSASRATRSAAAWAGSRASTASPRTPSRRSSSSRPTASSTASTTPTSATSSSRCAAAAATSASSRRSSSSSSRSRRSSPAG